MSQLSNLLRQVEENDTQLAADLAEEVKALSRRRGFGLNFERHIPEMVDLHGRQIRRGDKVRFLAPRGAPTTLDRRLWNVIAITRRGGEGVARLVPTDSSASESEPVERAVEDLVVVAEFRDPIHPGLVSTGKVERGGDKPFHAVINAENFHALQALLYTHEGKIDAIYIDPPYNTRAKDWKYNNDYVDSDDIYRHSKWLAMMERRLKLAKRLLDPENSVLIVTIDENEVHRLRLLLDQTIPEGTVQMVTSVINPKGTPKRDYLARVEEHIFLVYMGSSKPAKTRIRMLRGEEVEQAKPVRWASLRRSGGQSKRQETKVKFYPIFLDEETGHIERIGDHVELDCDIDSVHPRAGEVVQWPIKKDGSHGCWQVSDDTLRQYLAEGRVQVGRRNPKTGQWTLNFLMSSDWERVSNGEVEVLGRDSHGALVLGPGIKAQHGKTVWTMTSHSGTDHGTAVLESLLPGRSFPYPKAVYAVEDVLRFFVGHKPEAVILDFFAGSGTTAHAVMRLNKQDGGRRQCIGVTNNEVAADEQKALREKRRRPGDPDWEALGICDYITKPRITAAITGKTPDGEPIKGDYKFTDEFPMAGGFEENAEFFTMTYEAPRPVAHHRSFRAIAPLLWLRAGARGQRIDAPAHDFAVADAYTILFDTDYSGDFLAALEGCEHLRVAFIVTDDDRAFQMVCSELPPEVEAVRLYSSYLTNFEINAGRE